MILSKVSKVMTVSKVMIGILILMVATCSTVVSVSVTEKDRLMQQCMQDGNKEYVCESMLGRRRR
tara:strand:+ start:3175 stop:3369 length:195 start_codon:yes stop_codon:yes gene_type:complete